jgi:hypothetical protein
MTAPDITTEKDDAIQEETDSVIVYATDLQIENEKDLSKAGDFLVLGIKPVIKLVLDAFDPICAATNKAHKEATKQRQRKLEPLKQAEKIIKSKIAAWVDERARTGAMLTVEGHAELVSAVAKPEGISTSDKWSAEVTDFFALVRGVVNDEAPTDVLQPNQKRLDEMARALRDGLKIPGVKAVRETVVRATTR